MRLIDVIAEISPLPPLYRRVANQRPSVHQPSAIALPQPLQVATRLSPRRRTNMLNNV